MADEIIKDGEVKPVETKPVTTSKTKTTAVASFIAGAVMVLGGDGMMDAQQEAKAVAYADSVAHVEFVIDSVKIAYADSTNRANLNVKDSVFYAPARAKEKGDMGYAKINPQYYLSPEEVVIVKNFRVSGKDTVLFGVSVVEGKEYWLFDQKNKSVPTPVPVIPEPVEEIAEVK